MNNLTLPSWTKSVFPDKISVPAGFSFATPTWTTEMKRLRGGKAPAAILVSLSSIKKKLFYILKIAGPLVKEMVGNMNMKIDGTLDPPTRNISMYSAHDTTVAAFLNTINAFNFLPPPFASLVMVELRKTAQSQYHVTVNNN